MYDYKSPDPITQATYVPPEQKRDQDPPLKLTPPKRVLKPTPPTRVNITYQEGETVGESPQVQSPNFSAPPSVPPSRDNSLSLSFTQSSHSPVDNLLNKFKNTQFFSQPPPLPSTLPPMSLPNDTATSRFQPINSRASSPKTSTPKPTPPPIPKEDESRQESQYNRSASRSFSRHSRHGGSLSRNTCGSLNSSVYKAKIESLQEQVQTLLNQSAEKQDKLLRMESELEETKRQMKELLNAYKQEQVKKTIQNEIPQSKRHREKTHFEEEKSQTFLHRPEPVRPQYTVPSQSHPPPQFKVPQKPPVYNFPPHPIPLEPEVKVQPTQFPGTPIPPTHHPAPVPTQFPPQPAPVEEKVEQAQNSTLPPPHNAPPTEDKIFFQTLTQALSHISRKMEEDQTFRASAPRRSNSLQVRLPDLPHFDASLPEIIVRCWVERGREKLLYWKSTDTQNEGKGSETAGHSYREFPVSGISAVHSMIPPQPMNDPLPVSLGNGSFGGPGAGPQSRWCLGQVASWLARTGVWQG